MTRLVCLFRLGFGDGLEYTTKESVLVFLQSIATKGEA